MKKECFGTDFVDSEKYRECAECNQYEECTGAVYAGEAKAANAFGQAVGLVLGIMGAVLSAFWMPAHPIAGSLCLFVSVIYLLAVFRAGREAAERYDQDREVLTKQADAKGAEA